MTPLPVSHRWRSGQIKNVATVTLGKMLQPNDSGDDILACYMRAANVQPAGELMLEAKQMWFSAKEREALTLQCGDVVVVEGGIGGYGRAAHLAEDLKGWGFQNSINRLRPNSETDGRFVAYYLIALRASGFIERYCNVVSMPHLTAEKLAAIPVPIPPSDEQRAVADYLDRETARIDILIQEQRQLIAMLLERRESVADQLLSQADGLCPLKRVVDAITVGIVVTPSAWYAEEGVPALRGLNVRPGQVVPTDLVYLSAEGDALHDKSRLRAGDIVVVRTGQAGAAAVVPPEFHGANAIDLLIIRTGSQVDSDFLAAYLNAPSTRSRINEGSVGAIQGHFNVGALRELTLPSIDVTEQRDRASKWRDQAQAIDALIAETETFIELSRERRAALITAAVTGQIDVRDEAA